MLSLKEVKTKLKRIADLMAINRNSSGLIAVPSPLAPKSISSLHLFMLLFFHCYLTDISHLFSQSPFGFLLVRSVQN